MSLETTKARMISRDLMMRGIVDPCVLDAMRAVDRTAFVPAEIREYAYDDRALPLSHGQTISQPYIVAYMAQALKLRGPETVLDVGTGSGYAAAVLSHLCKVVVSVERDAYLADTAYERLAALGIENVEVHVADGWKGWPSRAPYDAIHVAAAASSVPMAFRDQLAIGGRLVLPVGERFSQQVLKRITKSGDNEFSEETLLPVGFVPLVEGADAPLQS